ncbi:ectoine/hydroxyectoine ABC transporter permease subunit EhuC, partial [Streptomyces sp. FT05W]
VLAYTLTLLMNLLERSAKRRLGLHTGGRSLFRTRTAEAVTTAGGTR